MTIDAIMRMAPVIPVLVIDGTLDPVALAETLVEAGLPVIEVTLRTPTAPWQRSGRWPLSKARWSEPAPCSTSGCWARRSMPARSSSFRRA